MGENKFGIMENEIIIQKSWLSRNYKWLVPVIVILMIAIYGLVSSGFGGILSNYTKAYNDPELYEGALKEVRQNERVKTVLGNIQPIDNMTIMNGAVNYSEDNKTVNSTIKIKGDNGKAMLDISAIRAESKWDYTEIKVRIKSPQEKKETIKIVSTEN